MLHTFIEVRTLGGLMRARMTSRPQWVVLAQATAAIWSLAYLGFGIAWLMGADGNPADPTVDGASRLSLLGLWGARSGAAIIVGLAAVGVLLSVALFGARHAHAKAGPVRRLSTVLAGALGLVLAVGLPDYRLLASIAYTPILVVLTLFGAAPKDTHLWTWPVVNMAILTIAGLAWITTAVVQHRDIAGACIACGRAARDPAWTRPDAAARWGRWATAVAVAIPLGYATTRFAWALGFPLGVSQQLLDELGTAVYFGAGLATLAVVGAFLTLGLVQRWGEAIPRWLPGVGGRNVPVGLVVVPATVVSVILASAGLMFVRFAVSGQLAATFPGGSADVAAWLPEMFWPLWAAALAAATYAYWLRRRGVCRYCNRGEPTARALPPDAGRRDRAPSR